MTLCSRLIQTDEVLSKAMQLFKKKCELLPIENLSASLNLTDVDQEWVQPIEVTYYGSNLKSGWVVGKQVFKFNRSVNKFEHVSNSGMFEMKENAKLVATHTNQLLMFLNDRKALTSQRKIA